MKFNADAPLLDRRGQIVRQPVLDSAGAATLETEVVTHGMICVAAIDAPLDGDDKRSPAAVRSAWMLGTRLSAGGSVELTAAEAAELQTRVVKRFALGFAGPVVVALDGDAPTA